MAPLIEIFPDGANKNIEGHLPLNQWSKMLGITPVTIDKAVFKAGNERQVTIMCRGTPPSKNCLPPKGLILQPTD